MTEEYVTKTILSWLIDKGWEIICYDFPQSGTGKLLHPNESNSKNRNAISPDVVAVKDNICIFLENKDRYYYKDIEKQNQLIKNNNYSVAINNLLEGYNVNKIYYGVGVPVYAYTDKLKKKQAMVDFVIGVNDNNETKILHLNDIPDVFK